MDVVGSFGVSRDTLHKAEKLFVGTIPYTNRFVIIRTNDLAILQVCPVFGSIILLANTVGMCDVGSGSGGNIGGLDWYRICAMWLA